MIVMITHRFGMAIHQLLSHAAIVGYSMLSHDNLCSHVAKPHGVNLIGATEIRYAMSASPRYSSMYTRLLRLVSGKIGC